MVTLHIEHAITEYGTWRQAFDRFAQKRRDAGVLAHRIHQPLGDDRYVLVDLDFGNPEQASAFLEFLTNTVWPASANAPALAGAPQARVLTLIDAQS
jgi:hypothetical protein